MDLWAYVNHVQIDFSRPNKLTDNAYTDSFNGRLRDECLNSHCLVSEREAKWKAEAGQTD